LKINNNFNTQNSLPVTCDNITVSKMQLFLETLSIRYL